MEYYSAIKRKKIGSFAETWMDPETVTQHKVNQKKSYSYIYVELEKTVIYNPIYKAEIDTQTQRANVWTPRGGRGWDELRDGQDVYTLFVHVCVKLLTHV